MIGTVLDVRGTSPRVARPDVFIRDLAPELAELAATAPVRTGLSEIGDDCGRERHAFGRVHQSSFARPRSVPLELLAHRDTHLRLPAIGARTARIGPCRATYALSAGRYRWQEPLAGLKP